MLEEVRAGTDESPLAAYQALLDKGVSFFVLDVPADTLLKMADMAKGKNVLEVERQLLRHVPRAYLKDAHHWLILHGRYTCLARKPRCGSCVIEDMCEYPDKIDIS